MRLPPGIKREDFAAALEKFATAVGPEWVYTADADVDLYRDAYSPFPGEAGEIIPAAAVAPADVEQVQQVLRVANAHRVPIYPISTGKNLGYGGSAPVLSGSVVLDLKRMNRILEVNERNACALVEPGVSYFDLYRHLQERGQRLWIDVPDPGWGSLIGNALDHGAGYTVAPMRDHFDAHCGMEVVLANGDVVRTGMGALPGAKTWQQFKYGVGPIVDGLFSQSNFGVVTKMGFWLYPEPEAHRAGSVTVPKHDDVHRFVDILAYLMNSGIANSTIQVRSAMLEAAAKDQVVAALLGQRGGPSAQDWDRVAADRGLASWGTKFNFYGPAKVIDAQWEYVKERFGAIPGVRFEDGATHRFPLSREQVSTVEDKAGIGIPSLSIFAFGARSRDNPSPTSGHLWFSPIVPMSGEALIEARRVFFDAFREWGVAPLGNGLPYSFHPRSFLFLFGFQITPDVAVNRKNRDTFSRMIQLAAEHGWGEYRTHPAFMDPVTDAYSFNNHALKRLHESLKDAVDPNGILSAGRYGIWPRHLRGRRT